LEADGAVKELEGIISTRLKRMPILGVHEQTLRGFGFPSSVIAHEMGCSYDAVGNDKKRIYLRENLHAERLVKGPPPPPLHNKNCTKTFSF
jgi:hypothetical protein